MTGTRLRIRNFKIFRTITIPNFRQGSVSTIYIFYYLLYKIYSVIYDIEYMIEYFSEIMLEKYSFFQEISAKEYLKQVLQHEQIIFADLMVEFKNIERELNERMAMADRKCYK